MTSEQRKRPMAELWPMMEDAFRQGLSVTIGITGYSMRPLFWPGRDSVVLSPCDAASLRRGDVPLYRRADGSFVLHRIVRVGKTTYTMAGDAQRELEYDVPKENVLAVMTGFVRKGKTVSCRAIWYRVFAALWLLVRPFRPWILGRR